MKNDESSERTKELEIEAAAALLRQAADVLHGLNGTQDRMEYFGIKATIDVSGFLPLANEMRDQATKMIEILCDMKGARLALAIQLEEEARLNLKSKKASNGSVLS